MERWAGKVAIVTGASGGIGAVITEALVKSGMNVVGLARRVEKIEELAASLKASKGKLYAVQCDVTKEEDILKAFEWTERELGGVDVLVNNAGVAVSESIIDGSTENFRKIMDVNVIAVAICTRQAIRSIKKRNAAGHIVIINSLAGHFAESIRVPMSLYPASKYAVNAMSLGLRNEISAAKINVKLTSISPGAVDTDMIRNTGLPKEIMDQLPMLQAKDVADATIYALSAPPQAQVSEIFLTPYSTTLDASDVFRGRMGKK